MRNQFEHIYLINLERRPDRLEAVAEQLQSIGVTYEVVKAIDGDVEEIDFVKRADMWNKNSAALALTTLKILEDAKKNNYKSILIFEDDIEFTVNASRMLDRLKWLKSDEWDMLHFGTIDKERVKKYNNSWSKLTNSFCCHAYAINSNCYDEYIEEIEKMDRPIDHITIDTFQTKGKCYKMNNTVCYQKKDFSNIRKRKVKYIIR